MYVTLAKGSESSALMTTASMRLVTVCVLAVVALSRRSVGGASWRDAPALIAIGLLDAGANVTYGWASTQGLLTNIAVLASIYPVVTALLAAWVLHERLKPVQYVGVGATVFAIAMISGAA